MNALSVESMRRPLAGTTVAGRRESEGGREFHFTARDFSRIREMIHRRAGIALGDAKREMAYSRLTRRLRALGQTDFGRYLDRLEADADDAEWENFVNALTTNLTAFFRESHHFDMLGPHLAKGPKGPRQRVWCCAASTGEEPYSIAITAQEAQSSVEILATDIDTQVLDTARRGVYPMERIEGLSRPRIERNFQRGSGPNEGYCRVRPALRSMIDFRPLNLLDPRWPVSGPLSAIFCRNVLIYFDRQTQQQLVQRLMALLADDGILFLGHSEANAVLGVQGLQPLGRTAYRRSTSAGRRG